MDTLCELIERIEKHCEQVGISTSTFGRKVVNDGKLVARLKAGKSIRLDTLEKINNAISSELLAKVEPAE